MLRLISTVFILLLTPINAMAIEINDEGAKKLKNSFQRFLDYQKTSNEAFGELLIIYKGELKIDKNEKYYTITFPDISIKNKKANKPDKEEKDFTFNIGAITMNAIPDEKPDYWKIVLSLPNKMTLSDNTDNDLVIEFKEQNTIALFNDRLGYFTKANLMISDISVTDGGKEAGFSLGNINLYSNMNEDEDSKFSGLGHISLGNLSISPPENSDNINIGEAKLGFTISDFKLSTLEEYSAKFLKHSETFNSLGNLEQDTAPKNINSDNVVEMILDLYDFEMDGFDFEYSFKDLEINTDINKFKLGSAFTGLGLVGLNSDKGSIHIKAGYDEVNIAPIDPEYSDLLPNSANIDIKVTNVPYPALTDIGTSIIKTIAKNPDMATMAGASILMRLPTILMQSDTQIIIDQNGIKNDIYALKLDGKVIADITAMMGFSAKFKAVFSGLDDILSISNKYAKDGQSKKSDKFVDLSKTLEKLKEIGKSETSENGKTSYIFEFETTPEGQFLVNGQDTSTISFE